MAGILNPTVLPESQNIFKISIWFTKNLKESRENPKRIFKFQEYKEIRKKVSISASELL